ncbi:C40 family peptidase [Spirochaeta dissipatitropha]
MKQKSCCRNIGLVLFLVFHTAYLFSHTPVRTNKPEELRESVIDSTFSYLGTPYIFGGTHSYGLDCSGLVSIVYYEALGRRIPRTVAQLREYAVEIEPEELLPGDLVFYDTAGLLSHVGIYAGDGRLIHAASDYNRTGVVVSRLDREYYQQRFHSAGRFQGGLDREGMESVVDTAFGFVGTPYVLGGASTSGVDCSGLVYAVFREASGKTPPRTVRDIAASVDQVSIDELRPGDLLFFSTDGPLSHVGIYIGKNQFIHAASEAIRNGVIYSDMNAPYYRERYHSSGRILPVQAIPWIIIRFIFGLEAGFRDTEIQPGLSSGVSLYFNNLGPVDPGLELRSIQSFTGDNLSIPLSLNLLLNNTGWLRFGYELHPDYRKNYLLAQEYPVVPQFYSTGFQFSVASFQGRSVALALEGSYHALDVGPDADVLDYLSLFRTGLFITMEGKF